MTDKISRSACAALAATFLFLAAGCQSAPPAAPTSISYQDVQTLPADQVKERLMAQLGLILTPAPPPPRWAPFIRSTNFYDTWMATEPRIDGGMCTYDLLRLKLAADTPTNEPDRNTPNHAVGLETTAWFTPVPAGTKSCAGRFPGAVRYFESDDPTHAEQDFNMLKDALARLNTASPGYAIVCDRVACEGIPTDLKAETLWDISDCYSTPATGRCRHFSWRDPEFKEMDIVYDTPKLDRRILSVRLEDGVIVN